MREGWIRAMEAAAISLFALLIAALIRHLGPELTRVWILVPGAIIGYLAADLVSGLVHWFCDNFLKEDSRVIGRLLIHPFREHHRDPLGMTKHGFLELTGNGCISMMPLLAAVVCWKDRIVPLPCAALLFFHLALFATNLFHKWAHASTVPRPIRWLQGHRLILTPVGHQVHHRNGYTGAYCITNGWMNRPLNVLLRTR